MKLAILLVLAAAVSADLDVGPETWRCKWGGYHVCRGQHSTCESWEMVKLWTDECESTGLYVFDCGYGCGDYCCLEENIELAPYKTGKACVSDKECQSNKCSNYVCAARTADISTHCTAGSVACCKGGNGIRSDGGTCGGSDCSNPGGGVPCEGAWMRVNCDTTCATASGGDNTVSWESKEGRRYCSDNWNDTWNNHGVDVPEGRRKAMCKAVCQQQNECVGFTIGYHEGRWRCAMCSSRTLKHSNWGFTDVVFNGWTHDQVSSGPDTYLINIGGRRAESMAPEDLVVLDEKNEAL